MRYRKLGRTELEVSEIGIGCSGFWGNKNFSEERAAAVIHEAFERGVNFFDTGHNYCNFNAEPRLGRCVKAILSRHDRSRIIISTKAGTTIGSASARLLRPRQVTDFSPSAIEASCRKSIVNLNCDYLDIFQLHGISEPEVTKPLLERLRSMKERGMFRYLGVNTHSQKMMEFVARQPQSFDMVLIDYNVLQLDRETVITDLHRSGVGVVAGTVLAQGHLIQKKIGSLRNMADLWYLARAMLKPTGRRLARSARSMQNVLQSVDGMSPSQAAFAYVLGNSNIASCVLGTTRVSNLLEVVDAVGKVLPEAIQTAIRQVFAELPETPSDG